MTKLKTQILTKLKQQQNSKTQIVIKLKNLIVIELKNSSCDKTQTKFFTKLKHSNTDNSVSDKT